MGEPAAVWTSTAMLDAIARDDAGAVIRLARRSADLNQTELGQRCGYSASTISRIERGQPPIHDIDARRRIARALGIPPNYLGLAATADRAVTRTGVATQPQAADGDMVSRTPAAKGDAVRRRHLLTGLTAAAVSWPWSTSASAKAPGPAGTLDDLLTASGSTAPPASTAEVRSGLHAAHEMFARCQYTDLGGRLSQLVAAAVSTRDDAVGYRREEHSALLAAAYDLASELCIKLDDDAIGWVLADRALTAAHDSGRPDAIAASTRTVAIAMRRAGHHDGATTLLATAATQLDPHHHASDTALAAYGSLLCTAAYSYAQHGNRDRATGLIAEAADAASRLSAPYLRGTIAFSPTNVAVYQIGTFTALGDSAAALDRARTVQPGLLPTAERYARYCIDTARAWTQHGRSDQAYQALAAAERHAPQELRRPTVRNMISTLLYAPTPTPPGLRELAHRVGATI